jgi:hypothetical protein
MAQQRDITSDWLWEVPEDAAGYPAEAFTQGPQPDANPQHSDDPSKWACHSYSWLAAIQQKQEQQMDQLRAKLHQASQPDSLEMASNTRDLPASLPPAIIPQSRAPAPAPQHTPLKQSSHGEQDCPVQQSLANQHPLQHNQLQHGASILRSDLPRSTGALRRRPDLAEKINPANTQVKTEYDSATIAHDVLINSGTHPTVTPLNSHLGPLRKNFEYIDYSSDLATFRWDIVDPIVPPTVTAAQGTWGHVLDPRDRPPLPARPIEPRPQQEETPSLVFPANSPSNSPPRPSRSLRERPTPPLQPVSIPNQQTQPSRTPKASYSPRTEHTSQLEALIPPKSLRMGPKRKAGRPPRQEKKAKKEDENKEETNNAIEDLEYPPIFECRWSYCTSRLNNLDTLERHILRAHITNDVRCGWDDCKDREQMPDPLLLHHVQKNHLHPLAMKLGDGMKILLPGKTA